VASTLEDITLTCPHEDPTWDTGTAAMEAYTTLVDQHMVPPEGLENMQHLDLLNRMLDLPPWDNLPLARYLGQLEDVHVILLLLVGRLYYVVPCLSLAMESTLGAFLLVDSPKQSFDAYTCSIEGQR
jgi:hypothetical protein